MALVGHRDNDALQLKIWERQLRHEALLSAVPIKLPDWFVLRCRKHKHFVTLATLQALVQELNAPLENRSIH